MTIGDKLKSFNDLPIAELRRAAVEDFAVDVRENANEDEIKTEFLEQGITFQMYLEQHPELVEQETRETEPDRGNIIGAGKMVNEIPTQPPVGHEALVSDNTPPANTIGYAEKPAFNAASKYVVKMDRENVFFENNGYRFTAEHPYAIVNAVDVDKVLEEDGFRLAAPSEAAEFYG